MIKSISILLNKFQNNILNSNGMKGLLNNKPLSFNNYLNIKMYHEKSQNYLGEQLYNMSIGFRKMQASFVRVATLNICTS